MTQPPSIEVPPNHTLHKENSAYLLLPSENGAFLNTIQEFNRDLSVACIRTWTERYNREKLAHVQSRASKHPRKKRRLNGTDTGATKDDPIAEPSSPLKADDATETAPELRPVRFTVLEPLSATGLRAIRYCNEIPLVKHVIANDLSKDATIAMKRNIEINNLSPSSETATGDFSIPKEDKDRPTVRVNHGDASALMYTVKAKKQPIHVIDLDPYGTAAPFIDAAVQTVTDDGLLCVTCTDLAVLAGTNYPEKCFANYGGTPAKGEYCHEAALRLVLGSLATSAARYGRSIVPLLSLSIDFYVRVFVQVKTSPVEVKKLSSKMATYHICDFCQNWHEQPLGRVIEKTSESGSVNMLYRTAQSVEAGQWCEECGGSLHIAGPMWRDSLHDKTFASEVLQFVEANSDKFGTYPRMLGMLSVANEELDTPFYFTPSKIAHSFHAEAPALLDTASALVTAGYQVSRSHALAGSLKTNATRAQLHGIFRSWVKDHPVKMSNIKEGSPSLKLLAKEATVDADFTRRPDALPLNTTKLVRYQTNPTPNWGPASRAKGKRKATQEHVAVGDEGSEAKEDIAMDS